jgi:dTDP-4-dehydrorhamnose reductase
MLYISCNRLNKLNVFAVVRVCATLGQGTIVHFSPDLIHRGANKTAYDDLVLLSGHIIRDCP